MKKIKINTNKKFIIILSVMIVAAIFLGISDMLSKHSNKQTVVKNDVPASNAKEQAYTASKTPTIKDDDKMFGSEDAAVKIFVYEDSASAYSAKFADTLDKIYIEKPNDVAIIIRPFIAKNSVDSEIGVLAVECAGDQDKWAEMRALIFSKVKNGELNSEEFNSYAKQIGLDENEFSACLTNQEKSAKIEELILEAENYEVIGAPTIFIGNEMILGARPYEDYIDSNGENVDGLKTIIDRKLE